MDANRKIHSPISMLTRVSGVLERLKFPAFTARTVAVSVDLTDISLVLRLYIHFSYNTAQTNHKVKAIAK